MAVQMRVGMPMDEFIRQGSDQITRLTADATLTGGDLLPDFALPLKEVFSAPA